MAEQPAVLSGVLGSNADALDAARALVGGARAVRFCGIGSSRNAAGYGAESLHVFAGLPSVVLPAPGAAVTMPEPRTDEPLIVVSQSGHSSALIELAEASRSAGCPVIAVTNNAESPLAELASVSLVCFAGPEHVVVATKSVSAQCLLLRALAGPVSTQRLVDAVEASLSLGVGLVARAPSSVVCAGFAAGFLAEEIALKLIEMSGLSVRSGTVVEHFHGPRAAGAPVLAFLDPDDPNSQALAAQPEVTTVGPVHLYDVETPTTGDASLDTIVNLVAGQRIAHQLALRIGEDPDASRGLSKVTLTR
jgi:glucosamine--fructose-6-phosphate aminotransferase (isomerizing)